MKKLLLFLALAAGAFTASASGLNVFASELTSPTANKVAFVLNDDANVVLNLIKDGTVVKNIEIGPCQKGANEFEIPDVYENGEFQWSLTASAEPVTEATLVQSCLTNTTLQIANTRSVAIDNNPESKFFGHIYVTSIAANGMSGARLGTGIYVLNAALEDFANQGDTPYAGGVSWSGKSSPMRVAVAEDGNVFISDWSDGHSGVWKMNPEDPSVMTEVFGGTRDSDGLASVDGVNVHGSVVDLCLVGKGADLKLYTADEDMPNVVNRYDLGESTDLWVTAPSATWSNPAGFANRTDCIESDRNGGIWLVQNRWRNSTANPSLFHLNTSGEWDYIVADQNILLGSTPFAALCVSPDGKSLAVACEGYTYVYDVEFTDGTPAITAKYTLDSPESVRPFHCDFDAAGNLYVAYNDKNGGVCQYSLPKAENKFDTPAPSFVTLTNQTGIFETAVEGRIRYAGGVVSAPAGAEIFNALGAKVAEGTEISTESLAAGVYIVRSGKQALKIVR